MNSSQLHTALANHRLTAQIYKDVRPADRLPKNQLRAFVINTHPSHLPGEHWVVLLYTDRNTTYFDPYGLQPPNIIGNQLTEHKLSVNTTRFQGSRNTCGLYCMYYILTTISPNHSMDIFADDLDFNDRLVHKLVYSMFHLK